MEGDWLAAYFDASGGKSSVGEVARRVGVSAAQTLLLATLARRGFSASALGLTNSTDLNRRTER